MYNYHKVIFYREVLYERSENYLYMLRMRI